VDSDYVQSVLKKEKIVLEGEKLGNINLEEIENCLEDNPYIDSAECYHSDRGTLCINVTPQKPILMVMAENGEQYYLDKEGATMPLDKFNLQLCVATGNITPQFAKQHLLPLAHYIYGNPFWSEQIEQIHVFSQDNITLYPRVGNHTIVLGDSRNFEDKLNRMLLFYEKGLPQVGWNRYESINLAYKGQIVCKKRNNKNK
jgi:cell division protein FtsQ